MNGATCSITVNRYIGRHIDEPKHALVRQVLPPGESDGTDRQMDRLAVDTDALRLLL